MPVLCELQFYGMRIVRSWFPEVLVAMQDRLLRLQVRWSIHAAQPTTPHWLP